MARKRRAAGQIVTKLRQIEVLQGQGNLTAGRTSKAAHSF